ncbi:MAG: hypothetical protein U5J63_05060 [Fodinibius sp.]|nr:hypothetical protein [Fodinibius sp.]
MIERTFDLIIAYTQWGIEFLAAQIMTVEGMVAIVFGIFMVGLIAQLRN